MSRYVKKRIPPMKTRNTIYHWAAGATLATALLAVPTRAFAMNITCSFATIGPNSNPLTTMVGQARATFADWTTRDANGRYQPCSLPYAAGCWQWTQWVLLAPSQGARTAALHVESTVYAEYHLAFENPLMNPPNRTCFVDPNDGYGPGFGIPQGTSGCATPNWANEKRTMLSHAGDEVIDIWVEGSRYSFPTGWISTGRKQFDLQSFKNTSTSNENLWVLWLDGNWWVDGPLAPGTHNESAWAYSITEAQIESSDHITIVGVDDIATTNITP